MQEPSAAAAALQGLNAAIDQWKSELRDATNRLIALEQSGAEPVDPAESGGYNPDQAALARLNGHHYTKAPSETTNNPGIRLFEVRREITELKKTLDLAGAQWAAASVDLGRELLAKHDAEIRALHRKRALAIVETFACTAQIEALRLRLLQAGSSVAFQLDGFSNRLGGELNPPTPNNNWQRKYLSECLKAGIVSDEDLKL